MIWNMAVRNIRRNKRRTLITTVGLGLIMAVMMMTFALQSGSWVAMLKAAIEGGAGHMVVQQEGWQTEQEASMFFDGASKVQSELQQAYPDATVVRRTLIGGLITSANGSSAIQLKGIEPGPERGLTLLDDNVREGEWLSTDRDIVIGTGLARTLGVGLGDKVVFMAQVATDDVESRLYRVKGIYRTGTDVIDNFLAYTTVDSTAELFPVDDPGHQVAVILPNADRDDIPSDGAARVASAHEGLKMLTWKEALPLLQEQMELDMKGSYVIFLFMGIIVLVGVLNTVLMSVMERIREFGVLLALGMPKKRLVRMVLLEGLLLGFLGGLVANVVAFPVILWLQEKGIDYGDMMGSANPLGDVALDTVLRGQLSAPMFLLVPIGAAIMALVASIYPALKAARLQPVEAIRHT